MWQIIGWILVAPALLAITIFVIALCYRLENELKIPMLVIASAMIGGSMLRSQADTGDAELAQLRLAVQMYQRGE